MIKSGCQLERKVVLYNSGSASNPQWIYDSTLWWYFQQIWQCVCYEQWPPLSSRVGSAFTSKPRTAASAMCAATSRLLVRGANGDGSQLFVLLKATECQIQHPNVKVPLYPFFAPLKTKLHYVRVFFSATKKSLATWFRWISFLLPTMGGK